MMKDDEEYKEFIFKELLKLKGIEYIARKITEEENFIYKEISINRYVSKINRANTILSNKLLAAASLDEIWECNYTTLGKHIRKHTANFILKRKESCIKEENYLKKFLAQCSKDYGNGKLSVTQNKKLKEIGIELPLSNVKWNLYYNEYKTYVVGGNTVKWSTVSNGVNIGEWQRTQRKYYTGLDKDKKKLLLEAGFVQRAN